MICHMYFGLFKLCSPSLQFLFYLTLVPPSGHYCTVAHFTHLTTALLGDMITGTIWWSEHGQ